MAALWNYEVRKIDSGGIMTCPHCGSEDTLCGRDWKCLDCGWEWREE